MPEKAFPQTRAGMLDALAFVENACAGGDSERLDRAVLVVGEVLANAVEHGGAPPGGRIRIAIESTVRQLEVTIEEPSGAGSRIGELQEAQLPSDLLATSGRGRYLIHTLSDSVEAVGPAATRYSFCSRLTP